MNLILLLSVVTALSAGAFAFVAALWLKKLRQSVSATLTESARLQIRAAQRIGETLGHMQNQQKLFEQQLQKLAEAHLKLRHDLNIVATRVAHDAMNEAKPQPDRILH